MSKELKPTERMAIKMNGVPKLYRKIVGDSIRGFASPRTAIKAQCLECVGYVRAEVKLCTSFTCPLYMYRPYKE
jgi:hypothetical protein